MKNIKQLGIFPFKKIFLRNCWLNELPNVPKNTNDTMITDPEF